MGAAESWASSPARRRNMQANRSRDTALELAVRRTLHARGFRYRVDIAPVKGLRRRADIVFTRQRIAVFLDGCFWHGCPEHGTRRFATNPDYWNLKTASNVARDVDTGHRLEEAGWTVLRYWEHQDPQDVADAVGAAVHAVVERGNPT